MQQSVPHAASSPIKPIVVGMRSPITGKYSQIKSRQVQNPREIIAPAVAAQAATQETSSSRFPKETIKQVFQWSKDGQ